MNDPVENSLSAPLAHYAGALRELRPSRALDARIDAAIHDFSTSPRRARRRGVIAGLAAGLGALLMGGIMFWITRTEHGAAPTTQPSVSTAARDTTPQTEDPGFSVLTAGQYSLWPTEGAVYRVRAQLGATAAAIEPDGAVADERRFWVDVRIANDGSMRIVRVVPADSGWGLEY